MDFNLMNLVAKLTLDSSEYEKGLNGASESAGGFGSKLGAAAKGATALVAGGAAVVTAIGGAVVKGAGEVADFGDHIDKNSQKMGISAEAYQEWDAILQHSGSSIDSMQRGMITLSKAAEKGDDSFEKLGITQEELQSLNQEELFARTIEGLQNMESGTERTALASKLLGGSAKELGALLNTSAEDTEKMRQTVHDLGGVMSDDAVKAAAAYQDSLQDMNTAIDGAKRGIVSNFLPSITSVMDGITGLFSGDSSAIGKIEDGIDSFIKNLTGMIPKVIEKGTQIVMALLNAIITNLPAIIKAGFQAILQLAKGISDALPQLIPAAIDAVMEIVDGLIENIDLLVDAALQLMIGLAEGLIAALPKIIEKIPTIIEKLVNALVESAPKIAEAGVKLLTALVKNLPAIIAAIIKAIPEILQAIGKAVSDAWPEITKAVMEGLGTTGGKLIAGVLAAWTAIKGLGIVGGIAKAIGAIIPLISSLANPVTAIVAVIAAAAVAIIMNWDKIKAAWGVAVDFFKKIWSGITEAFKNVGTWISDKFNSAYTAVSNTWSKASGFFSGVWSGIKGAFSNVGSWLGDKFMGAYRGITTGWQKITGFFGSVKEKVVNVFTNLPDKFLEIGKNLLSGLGNGLVEGAKAVIEKAKKIASDVLGAVKSFFGVASPSKEFAKIGGFLMAGMAKGIDDNVGSVIASMGNLQNVVDANTPSMSFNAEGNAGAIRMIDGITMNIYGAEGQDVNALADAVADRFQTLVDMRAAVWA